MQENGGTLEEKAMLLLGERENCCRLFGGVAQVVISML
jgi:hypothetical protein